MKTTYLHIPNVAEMLYDTYCEEAQLQYELPSFAALAPEIKDAWRAVVEHMLRILVEVVSAAS